MKVKLSLAFFLFFLAAIFVSAQQKSRPNILWITIEDTSPQFIGAYGNKNAKTPNIDQLANEGIRFSNAFSTGTVCSPSRTAIITGVKTYETGTGNHRSSVRLPAYIKGFPFFLKQAGYYTSNNAKTDYNIAGSDKFIKECWDESSGKAGWEKRKPGQPFFAVYNFIDSHQSRTMTWPYDQYQKSILEKLSPEDRIGDNEFSVPPIYRDSPEMRKQLARSYNSLRYTDIQIGKLLEKLERDHLKDSTIIFFYADHGEGLPRGKTNGIAYGYRVPFIAWFPPIYQHLSPWGRAGLVSNELIDFEDLAPTMIALAGGMMPNYLKGRVLMGDKRTTPGKYIFLSNDRSDNGPDLSRTITDGRYLYSRNFMCYQPELRYIRYMEIGEIKRQMRLDFERGKLTPFQKSLFQPRRPEMLFDLTNDAWEMRNLADDPAHEVMIKKFRAMMKENVIVNQDVMFLPEYQTHLISPNQNLYDFRKDRQAYPITKIYSAAALAGFKGVEVIQKQVTLLKDRNPIIRYWAMLGLIQHDKKSLVPYKKAIIRAMDDSYPPVVIIASVLVYRDDDKEKLKAVALLKDFITIKNMDLSLMTVNLLLYQKNKKPFYKQVQSAMKNKNDFYDFKAACEDFLEAK